MSHDIWYAKMTQNSNGLLLSYCRLRVIRNDIKMVERKRQVIFLPLLNNPLLSCIFNNSHYNAYPFKRTIHELAQNHTQYMILVPPADVLNEHQNRDSSLIGNKPGLRELCYTNEDFIQSHIVKFKHDTSGYAAATSKTSLAICHTMNGKQLLIKNGFIFSGKGFKKSVRLSILNVTYFNSFCDYFPKGSIFTLIYISDSLYGTMDISSMTRADMTSYQVRSNTNADDKITFEKLLRTFPVFSKAVSDKFYKIFHHNNERIHFLRSQTPKRLGDIKDKFQLLLTDASQIVQDSLREEGNQGAQIHSILNQYSVLHADFDLNRLIHEYVELNVYDTIWSQIVFQLDRQLLEKEHDADAMKTLTKEKYDTLSCLSLNQLDVAVKEPWKVNELYRRIFKASTELSKLSDPTMIYLSMKMGVLANTIKILTNDNESNESISEKIIVNADILIALLIMVVVRARVDNLEGYLYYIKNFSPIDYSADGYICYIISNFDAVILHLSCSIEGDINGRDLLLYSKSNSAIWSYIQNGNHEYILNILGELQNEHPDGDLPEANFLKSKNQKGESCFMQAVKLKNSKVFSSLLDLTSPWISVEDILFDKSIDTHQTLLMTAMVEGSSENLDVLIQFLLRHTTEEELYAYINSQDKYGRTVGHNIFQNYRWIGALGKYIDWNLKDINSHTPLFILCRCYDHSEYVEMLELAFYTIYNLHGDGYTNFISHTDRVGNSLLHIILRGLENTKLLSSYKHIIEINQLNNKQLTPLMLYIKYGRVENLRQILKEDRVNIKYEEPMKFHTALDVLINSFLKFSSSDVSGKVCSLVCDHLFNVSSSISTEKLMAFSTRFEGRREWFMYYWGGNSLKKISVSDLKKLTFVFKKKNPYLIIPSNQVLWQNFDEHKEESLFLKLIMNRLADRFNVLTNVLSFSSTPETKQFLDGFSMKHQDGALTLEAIHNASLFQEGKGEDVLTKQKVEEMESFLKYSLSDLTTFLQLLTKLNKLLTVYDLKEADYLYIQNSLLLIAQRLVVFLERDTPHVLPIHEYDHNAAPMKILLSFLVFLEQCYIELSTNVRVLIIKLHSWSSIASEIEEITRTLAALKEQDDESSKGLVFEDTISKSLVDNMNIEVKNLEDSSNSIFGMGSFIETKATKYRKLLQLKIEKSTVLLKMNHEIKVAHECLATEISTFVTIRNKLLKLSFKVYIRCLLPTAKSRLSQYYRTLGSLSTNLGA